MEFDSKKEINQKLDQSINNTNKMKSLLYNSINTKTEHDSMSKYIHDEEMLLKEIKELYFSDRVKKEIQIK